MREPGIPKLLTWRWAPCAALVLGAFSFCGFMLLAIPDHIGAGSEPSSGPSLRLANQLSRTQMSSPTEEGSWGNAAPVGEPPQPSTASPVHHVADSAPAAFPKRGFTPPLDRPPAPEPAPAPPPVPVEVPAPAPEPAPPPAAAAEAAPEPAAAPTDPVAASESAPENGAAQ